MAHSVMFHHFHDGVVHRRSQGSLSAEDFSAVLDWLERRYRIIDAAQYREKLLAGELRDEEICLSFDDGLLCQAEIAAPILKQRDLRAFFFVYSAPFRGESNYIEIYRYFRNSKFHDIDHFYRVFIQKLQKEHAGAYEDGRQRFERDRVYQLWHEQYPFYSREDIWFRYLRDTVLGPLKYGEIMHSMMEEHSFCETEIHELLWMSDHHLRSLDEQGHVIGLHSYSHPTTLHRLPEQEQREEYERNYEHLQEVLGNAPKAMSHPCGSYDETTLRILSDLKIDTGFRANMSILEIRSNLEVPREDHANIVGKMREDS